MRGPYRLQDGEAPAKGYVKKVISYRMAYPIEAPASKKKAPEASKKKAPIPSKKASVNVTVRKKKKAAPFNIDYGKNKKF